jgi:hypothetical protein
MSDDMRFDVFFCRGHDSRCLSEWGGFLSPVIQKIRPLCECSSFVVSGKHFLIDRLIPGGKFSDGGWDKLWTNRHEHGIAAGAWREIQVIGWWSGKKAAEVQQQHL